MDRELDGQWNQSVWDRRINRFGWAIAGTVAFHAVAAYGLKLALLPVPPKPPIVPPIKFHFIPPPPPPVVPPRPLAQIKRKVVEIARKPEEQPKVVPTFTRPPRDPKPLVKPPEEKKPPKLTPASKSPEASKNPVLQPSPVPIEKLKRYVETLAVRDTRSSEQDPVFHVPQPLPDPTSNPLNDQEERSRGNLPSGMRQDEHTPTRHVLAMPSNGLPMDRQPLHDDHPHNGSGNSNGAGPAGPTVLATLVRGQGVGAGEQPTFAGGGMSGAPGVDGSGKGLAGSGSISANLNFGGGRDAGDRGGAGGIRFGGGHPGPAGPGGLVGPHGSGTLASRPGEQGDGGPGGPGGSIFSSPSPGGNRGGQGGGQGGSYGTGVGANSGPGGPSGGSGGGGTGMGQDMGAGNGPGLPGTEENGEPDGAGPGSGGGRTGPFQRGGGAPLTSPGGGNGLLPGDYMTGEVQYVHEPGCVLTNQQPPFDAAKWHDHSMTALLQFAKKYGNLPNVDVPKDTPDSYVNLIDHNINLVRAFTYDDIKQYPMIFITGDAHFTFTKEEREALLKYVMEDGGTIYGEDCHTPDGKQSPFDATFKEVMGYIFEGHTFETLPFPTHPLYNIQFKLDSIPGGDHNETAPFEGININGRAAVIYTINDYGDVWSPKHSYYSATLRPPAYRIGVNLYWYSILNFVAAHTHHDD